MSDKNVSLVPDVIKSASEAVQANIPETAKQTDGALSAVVGLFNNVVLYPIKKANLTFKYKLEAFETDLQEKTRDIPDKNLQTPPAMIAGPTLEALRYTYDEEELREMYENLLASSMDNRIATKAHPSFVDAIRQMSPLDAKVLSRISQVHQLMYGEIVFAIKNTDQMYMQGMPQYFSLELLDLGDPFDISASITNLKRLLLINVVESGFKNCDYSKLKNHPYVISRRATYDATGEKTETIMIEGGIVLNDYGANFVQICFNQREAIHAN